MKRKIIYVFAKRIDPVTTRKNYIWVKLSGHAGSSISTTTYSEADLVGKCWSPNMFNTFLNMPLQLIAYKDLL